MTGLTTVVIATRNRADELVHTLTRLRALQPAPPIIVVDNGSTDGTARRVAGFAGVRLVRLTRNMGAAARNIGVALAGTPFVAFSDDDSWWASDALSRAESVLTAYPEVGLVAAKTLVGPSARPDPVNEMMAHSPLGRDPALPGPSVLGFLACAAVVRTRAYLDVGGFSPLLHFAAEEKLLSYDLAARGWALCYVEDIRAYHHPSAARGAASRRRRQEQRNNALITWMRRPLGECLRALAGLVARIPRDPGAAVALAGALRRFPRALPARTPLPGRVEQAVRRLERA
jgi:GT2 family glycosyltransferase